MPVLAQNNPLGATTKQQQDEKTFTGCYKYPYTRPTDSPRDIWKEKIPAWSKSKTSFTQTSICVYDWEFQVCNLRNFIKTSSGEWNSVRHTETQSSFKGIPNLWYFPDGAAKLLFMRALFPRWLLEHKSLHLPTEHLKNCILKLFVFWN